MTSRQIVSWPLYTDLCHVEVIVPKYIDHGTTFVGAKNDFFHNSSNSIAVDLTKDGIQWHFIPPRAPHFGGLRESAVK